MLAPERRCENCNDWVWAPDVAQRHQTAAAVCVASKDRNHSCTDWRPIKPVRHGDAASQQGSGDPVRMAGPTPASTHQGQEGSMQAATQQAGART